MSDQFIRAHVRLRDLSRRVAARIADETGDVPGWVLITLMTAALVTGLWTVAGERLTALFQQALDDVASGP